MAEWLERWSPLWVVKGVFKIHWASIHQEDAVLSV